MEVAERSREERRGRDEASSSRKRAVISLRNRKTPECLCTKKEQLLSERWKVRQMRRSLGWIGVKKRSC